MNLFEIEKLERVEKPEDEVDSVSTSRIFYFNLRGNASEYQWSPVHIYSDCSSLVIEKMGRV